jgi:hypothetical protein
MQLMHLSINPHLQGNGSDPSAGDLPLSTAEDARDGRQLEEGGREAGEGAARRQPVKRMMSQMSSNSVSTMSLSMQQQQAAKKPAPLQPQTERQRHG